jgi:hypothetical protein
LKKATGMDNISAKILKLTSTVMIGPITSLVNSMIESSTFPDTMKIARVSPVYKKENPLDRKNYRPVSILPAVSKVFERTISRQLDDYFSSIFHPFLSAYRKGYSCQSVLLALTEEWRKALDGNQFTPAIMMDLSKAFDCVPYTYNLLYDKLSAYGLSPNAVALIRSYLTGRKQCVKVGNVSSSLKNIEKGVPQGSILGPTLFNIFVNDIFSFVKQSKLVNYADDNTLSFSHKHLTTLRQTLEEECNSLIKWFSANGMRANPDKFQAIAIGKKSALKNLMFDIRENVLNGVDTVKLLGVTIDSLLNFDTHIKNVCLKASRQINALRRMGKHLTLGGRKAIYHAFILSNFNFCPLVWHFCSKGNTQKLERVNYRALRFVFHDFTSDYQTLLDKCDTNTLEVSRLKQIAILTFKILNKEGPCYLQDFIKERSGAYALRYNRILEKPRTRTVKYGTQSFRNVAADTWNKLPDHVRTQVTLGEFKAVLRKWDGELCKCSASR